MQYALLLKLKIKYHRENMTKINRELLEELDPDLLLMDGFDDCIAGIVERYGEEDIICYDRDAVWDKLGKMGMSCEDAVEFYYFNQLQLDFAFGLLNLNP